MVELLAILFVFLFAIPFTLDIFIKIFSVMGVYVLIPFIVIAIIKILFAKK